MLIFLPIPIKAKYFIPGIIAIDLFSAVSGVSIFSPSNTAYIAHIGGALTGFLLMYFWKKNQAPGTRWSWLTKCASGPAERPPTGSVGGIRVIPGRSVLPEIHYVQYR